MRLEAEPYDLQCRVGYKQKMIDSTTACIKHEEINQMHNIC
ncbi:hypothetical protein AAJ76_307000369 [Vairimorpha ceranae]|uniref:Uncharacterized protein n=1 Tax=Vairimorpha ceranae TaxID=40302 RepID=A0A0F9Z6Y3_9MICR|nr:hypothetical protein AAJ76_307000369 [Vairimorpha ceranae]KKO73684.1 hypothetical protein AAJ76_307000369 [Vairimorpha ceranae]